MAMPRKRETVTFRDATLIFKNFAGEQRKFNQEGDRNFSILLSETDGLEMLAKGWNVKPLKRTEESDEQLYHLKVSVNFSNRPPRCWLITSNGRTMLGEGMTAMFDQLESERIDLEIVAYDWEVNGNSGRKAYLQSMFYHMYESELELEYADVPQIASVGDGAIKALEAGPSFDYEGDVVED